MINSFSLTGQLFLKHSSSIGNRYRSPTGNNSAYAVFESIRSSANSAVKKIGHFKHRSVPVGVIDGPHLKHTIETSSETDMVSESILSRQESSEELIEENYELSTLFEQPSQMLSISASRNRSASTPPKPANIENIKSPYKFPQSAVESNVSWSSWKKKYMKSASYANLEEISF